MTPRVDEMPPDYDALREVLDLAFKQASEGKGRARHANGQPFQHQPICEIARMVGPAFQSGQVMKKVLEAEGMVARGENDAAERELLGAINYLAARIIVLWEDRPA